MQGIQDPSPPMSSLLRSLLLTLASFSIGCLIVVQASMNIQLSVTLGGALRSSLTSFLVGMLLLSAVVLGQTSLRTRSERSLEDIDAESAHEVPSRQSLSSFLRSSLYRHQCMCCFNTSINSEMQTTGVIRGQLWWYYLGGVYGCMYITTTVFVIPYIGFSVFFVCHICGQLLCALLIDTLGWFGSEVRRIHYGRVAGCVTTAVGAVLLISGDATASMDPIVVIILVIVSVISGIVLPAQAATNSKLKSSLGCTAETVACISFTTSVILLFLINCFSFLFVSQAPAWSNSRWWQWCGGAVGVIFVVGGIRVAPLIGYSTFFVAVIAGQLSMSILSDKYGLLGPAESSADSPLAIGGVLLGIAGAVVVSVSKSVSSQPTTGSLGMIETVDSRISRQNDDVGIESSESDVSFAGENKSSSYNQLPSKNI